MPPYAYAYFWRTVTWATTGRDRPPHEEGKSSKATGPAQLAALLGRCVWAPRWLLERDRGEGKKDCGGIREQYLSFHPMPLLLVSPNSR
jgi:hypothetical protein